MKRIKFKYLWLLLLLFLTVILLGLPAAAQSAHISEKNSDSFFAQPVNSELAGGRSDAQVNKDALKIEVERVSYSPPDYNVLQSARAIRKTAAQPNPPARNAMNYIYAAMILVFGASIVSILICVRVLKSK